VCIEKSTLFFCGYYQWRYSSISSRNGRTPKTRTNERSGTNTFQWRQGPAPTKSPWCVSPNGPRNNRPKDANEPRVRASHSPPKSGAAVAEAPKGGGGHGRNGSRLKAELSVSGNAFNFGKVPFLVTEWTDGACFEPSLDTVQMKDVSTVSKGNGETVVVGR
jgi:hypothetical protein